jgi:hypothetical protein
VEVEETPPSRNVLTRPREATPRPANPTRRVVVREAAPPEVEEEVEEVEMVTRSVRPVTTAPRAAVARPVTLRAVQEEAQPELVLIQPGPLDRLAGAIGARLSRRAMPRVQLDVETQQTYRLASAPRPRVVSAPPAAPTYAVPAQPICAPPAYAPPVYPPPTLPSAQTQGHP